MRLTAAFLAALAATSAFACSIVGDVSDCPRANFVEPQCGTQSPSKEALEQRRVWIRDTPTKVAKPITVDTYFHFVYYKGKSKVNYKKDFQKKYKKQLEGLNRHYAPHGISFKLMDEPDYTENAEWAEGMRFRYRKTQRYRGTHPEIAMKAALRKGDAKTLNLYYIPGLTMNTNGSWGWTETSNDWDQPSNNVNKDFLLNIDGVEIDANTMPGSADEWSTFPNGTAFCYNCRSRSGKITTHEVGHWMGLLHPFEGGCTEERGGDLVLDTPPEAMPRPEAQTCNHPVNSCPDKKGLDSIHNYMNYLPEDCRTEFTSGQKRLMYAFWENSRVRPSKRQYRNKKFVVNM